MIRALRPEFHQSTYLHRYYREADEGPAHHALSVAALAI
jgi:hypothetical protein